KSPWMVNVRPAALLRTALPCRLHRPEDQAVLELRFMVRPSSVLVVTLAVRPPLTLKTRRLFASLSVMVPPLHVMAPGTVTTGLVPVNVPADCVQVATLRFWPLA